MDETLKARLKKDIHHKDNSYYNKSFFMEVEGSLAEIGNVERCHKFLDFLDDTVMKTGRWRGKDTDIIMSAKNSFMGGVSEEDSSKVLLELRGRFVPYLKGE